MKQLLILLSMASLLWAAEILQKNGKTLSGDVICQEKGKIIVKQGNEVVSIYKKSIVSIDSFTVKGKKKFHYPDSLMMSAKNELTLENSCEYPIVVKVRKNDKTIILEKELNPKESYVSMILNGSYYTTTKYNRPDSTYYITGNRFTFEPPCQKFERLIIELKNQKNFPHMKNLEREFLQ